MYLSVRSRIQAGDILTLMTGCNAEELLQLALEWLLDAGKVEPQEAALPEGRMQPLPGLNMRAMDWGVATSSIRCVQGFLFTMCCEWLQIWRCVLLFVSVILAQTEGQVRVAKFA
jgi:hypothetical protein